MSITAMHGGPRQRGDSPLKLMLDEATSIAEDARDYLHGHRQTLTSPVDKLAETAEISRITSRVGFIVAWLLTRKAVHAGEIAEDEARGEDWRLGGAGVCDEDGVPPRRAPPQLLRLGERSRRLWDRVSRLDANLDPHNPDPHNPDKSGPAPDEAAKPS